MNHVLDEGQDPLRQGKILGLSGPLKSILVFAAEYAAKGIIQSSITALNAMRPFVVIV